MGEAKIVQPGQKLDQDQKRYYQRLTLRDPKYVRFVDTEKGNIFNVRNISYGGMLLQKGPLNNPDFDSPIIGKLTFMGEEIAAKIEIVHENDKTYGVRFIHDEADVLLFLRGKLEFVRYGDTLRPIDPKNYNERYRDGNWQILHGDGPISLRVRHHGDDNSEIDRFEMTIRPLEYATILYENGHLQEARMHEFAVHLKSEVVAEHEGLNPDLARGAALIIMGIQHPGLKQQMDTFLPLLMKQAHIEIG